MNFKFDIPTSVYFGNGAVRDNSSALVLGKCAFVVAGENSGRRSGALDDVQKALDDAEIEYKIFEGIANNPNVLQCKYLGDEAREFGADFIIGIGGGSPLDAAKAVAVFALNDIPAGDIFKNEFKNGVLPIVAVPTTSGTGSEVTPWSVMTWDEIQTKQSFGCDQTYPRMALLDPRYTESLPQSISLDTAMDAFEHCFESIISLKANPITDAMNFYALKLFAECMQPLSRGEFAPIREKLMLISMLGGMTISQTGTTLMHALGYPLTYFKDVPHGRANCMVLPTYIEELKQYRPDRLKVALNALGCSQDELCKYVKDSYPLSFSATDDELRLWASQTSDKRPDKSTGTPQSAEHLFEVYKRMFR
ncbi:MAG: iron-containing alcohol dehydrogenase family protein [Clostridia bacterium]